MKWLNELVTGIRNRCHGQIHWKAGPKCRKKLVISSSPIDILKKLVHPNNAKEDIDEDGDDSEDNPSNGEFLRQFSFGTGFIHLDRNYKVSGRIKFPREQKFSARVRSSLVWSGPSPVRSVSFNRHSRLRYTTMILPFNVSTAVSNHLKIQYDCSQL